MKANDSIHPREHGQSFGISVRDHIAIEAMKTLLTMARATGPDSDLRSLCTASYRVSDAMIAASSYGNGLPRSEM